MLSGVLVLGRADIFNRFYLFIIMPIMLKTSIAI